MEPTDTGIFCKAESGCPVAWEIVNRVTSNTVTKNGFNRMLLFIIEGFCRLLRKQPFTVAHFLLEAAYNK
jgi:hypothetical protein